MKKDKKRVNTNSDTNGAEQRRAKRKNAMVFVAIFAGVMAAYYVSVMLFKDNLYSLWMDVSASLASIVLNAFGAGTQADGSVISSSSYAIQVSFGCEGTEPIALVVAAISAFPIAWRRKFVGIGAGIGILFVLNLFRIAALYAIGMRDQEAATMYHLEIFPILFIIFAIIIWGVWIRWALRAENISQKPSGEGR